MPRFTLTLALATLALPALAQQPEGRGAVYAGVGYFASDDTYGDELDLGARVLTADLGAEAHLLRRPHVTGTLGATLRMAEAEYAPLSSSGFQPQHLDLYARLAGDFVSATAGFVVDLGPEDTFRGVAEGEDPEEDLHFFNSDVQHAVRLGVHGEAPAGAFRLHGAVDGFLTLPYGYTTSFVNDGLDVPPFEPGEEVEVEGEVDFGDTFVVRAGAGYTLGVVALGLDLVYAATTAGESVTRASTPGEAGPEFREPLASRALFSVVPSVTVAPEGAPFSCTLAAEAPGGAYAEHVPYGITLAGDAQWKVRVPLSLRVRYGL